MTGAVCEICPHRCRLEEGQTGLCRARSNHGGKVLSDSYGLITSMALDPIEKKPLRLFFPGSAILSVGSFGCNMRCPFCQNFEISQRDKAESFYNEVSPGELVSKALSLVPGNNIGIAFTYNEPFVGYEYVYDTSVLAHKNGLKTVLVTNGFVNEEPLKALLPHIDAMNIDLKTFSESYYHKLGANLKDILRTITLSAAACHVELTTLIIPGENDSEDEMRRISDWIAGIRPDIPLHISRFFPRYKMLDRAPTDTALVYRLAEIAREKLIYVFEGNC